MATAHIILTASPDSPGTARLQEMIRRTVPGGTVKIFDASRTDFSADGQAEKSSSSAARLTALSKGIADYIKSSDGGPFILAADTSEASLNDLLPRIVSSLQDNDLVVASQYVTGPVATGQKRRVPLGYRLANLLAWPLAPRIKDRISTCIGFRKGVIDARNLDFVGQKTSLGIIALGNYRTAAEIPAAGPADTAVSPGSLVQYVKDLISLYMTKFRILNFMVVGGIGYVVNMGAYWVLLKALKSTETTILGQHFYLPPFVISSLIAITCNYLMNKLWTFRGWGEQSLSFLRYLSMALVTLVFDIALLAAFVDIARITPILAAALAIAIVFILRYTIAKRWIWSEK